MKITELPMGILYIEDVFTESEHFIQQIEKYDLDELTHSVIPPWEDWRDSRPVKSEGSEIDWKMQIDTYSKGKQKLFDWDRSASNYNLFWPRPEYVFEDYAHKTVEKTIDLIDKPYKEIIKIWSEKTGNKDLEYISKNYFLRKYKVGGKIGPHVDKNVDNPLNTMDWSVLFYLNDNYSGGEILFPDLDIKIKPSAGSALIFPCTAVHVAEEVTDGEKYYIFMVIHSEFGYSSALGEEYHLMNEAILEHKGVTDHILLDIKAQRYKK